MGISGLLPLLKSIMNPIHVKELKGCIVAVDTYSWLHKGAFSCSTELCKGRPTNKHIEFCMHRVNMLRHYGVKPILVFDGGPLPIKSEQEAKRARSRKEYLSRAMEHESNGNLSAAHECYQKAVDISPSVAYELIQVLKQENVSYIVAPYEADAQMAFMAINEQVEAVITEDSDLIAFGCPRIIYKMDKFGHGVEFKNCQLEQNKDLQLTGFTQMMILEMCILSGCDYLQSLPGMGLKKAHAFIKKFKTHDKVIKHLQFNGIEVPLNYEESFKKAVLTFRHQRVYDPATQDVVHLSEPMDIGEDLDFLGPSLPQHLARGIAQGDVDPCTKAPFERESELTGNVVQGSYSLDSLKSNGKKKGVDLPAQKNLLTNYFCFASVEARREFRAPRLTSKHPSLGANAHQVAEVQGRVKDIDMVSSKLKPCTTILHSDSVRRDLDSRKTSSINRNGIVRSIYFMKNSEEQKRNENASDSENGVDPDLVMGASGGSEDKRVTYRSHYFPQRTGAALDGSEEICDDENSEGPESEGKPNGSRLYEDEILRSPFKKRKVTEAVSPKVQDDAKINGLSSGSDLEQDTKFGCNISHLDRYSGIAEKSLEKFVSVLSSFKYKPQTSRPNAAALRTPLKHININSNKRAM